MRVAIIDSRPAMRAGIEAILERADAQVVARAGLDHHEIVHALYRTAPDIVIVEDTPGRADGVDVARELKALGPGPKVLLLTDRLDAVQVATAVLADADGVLDSGAQPREIIESLRTVAAGGTAFPQLSARQRGDLARRLPAEDHAILALRLAATPRREISDTLRIDARALRRRLLAMIGRLRASAAATLSAAPPGPLRGPAPSAGV
jgi:two-component system, NarL family, response regulator DevR